MDDMTHLTVGLGEVGSAIRAIAGGFYQGRTDGDWDGLDVDIASICIPFTLEKEQDFIDTVNKYKKKAKLVVVHSSVPVGTCDDLGVVHSPVRGVHPHMEEGIRTFVKYFGGKNAQKAADFFAEKGLKTKVFEKARTTEALKLWDTTQYGTLIILQKVIHKWCVDNKVDFEDVYTQANKDYNEGYMALGRPEVVRPYLTHMPGPIGGHCVVENSILLGAELPKDI